MATSLTHIAQLVDGELVGDGSLEVSGAGTLNVAGPRDITLFDRVQPDRHLAASDALAFVVPNEFIPHGKATIHVDNVHAAFAKIVGHFRPARTSQRRGISEQAIISDTAIVADDVDVHPFATIGEDVEIAAGTIVHSGVHIAAGCRIGCDTTIFPNAVLYENTLVGDRVIIHAGAVLGAYGFGYDSSSGEHKLSAQLGYVEIRDDVDIGAGTTIDCGTYGPTTIGQGTKIDNLVMVAHNCQIGRRNMLCSQVGIAGSTTTGDYVVMAGQVGVRDHVHIGERAVLGAMAGVTNDVAAGESVLGAPAVPVREMKLRFGVMAKLPEMRKQLKQLQRTVDAMQAIDDSKPSTPDTHAA